ncbi:hypothetical protein KI387_017824, partial [Taxus chinensis]
MEAYLTRVDTYPQTAQLNFLRYSPHKSRAQAVKAFKIYRRQDPWMPRLQSITPNPK